mmetsp:Transcript_19416/g.61779  ORF Transcript_19416/g.61779 Transcript_19416/m.61779 type:complete len:225 (-) Transcript_19416:1003-1677(-)
MGRRCCSGGSSGSGGTSTCSDHRRRSGERATSSRSRPLSRSRRESFGAPARARTPATNSAWDVRHVAKQVGHEINRHVQAAESLLAVTASTADCLHVVHHAERRRQVEHEAHSTLVHAHAQRSGRHDHLGSPPLPGSIVLRFAPCVLHASVVAARVRIPERILQLHQDPHHIRLVPAIHDATVSRMRLAVGDDLLDGRVLGADHTRLQAQVWSISRRAQEEGLL